MKVLKVRFYEILSVGAKISTPIDGHMDRHDEDIVFFGNFRNALRS
jgi:hypothetical protein